MKIINRLLDYSRPWDMPHVALFTGNPIRKNNGAIVMGRGAAKAVRDTYPGIDVHFGDVVSNKHLAWVNMNEWTGRYTQWIGWFKVKNHWRDAADPWLIQVSADHLAILAEKKPEVTFHMNAPGIGNGRLSWAHVEKLLEVLPDNVWIYKI